MTHPENLEYRLTFYRHTDGAVCPRIPDYAVDQDIPWSLNEMIRDGYEKLAYLEDIFCGETGKHSRVTLKFFNKLREAIQKNQQVLFLPFDIGDVLFSIHEFQEGYKDPKVEKFVIESITYRRDDDGEIEYTINNSLTVKESDIGTSVFLEGEPIGQYDQRNGETEERH